MARSRCADSLEAARDAVDRGEPVIEFRITHPGCRLGAREAGDAIEKRACPAQRNSVAGESLSQVRPFSAAILPEGNERGNRFDALEWQSFLPGARFKAYRSGGKQIRLVEFTSEFIEPHWCEKGHIGLILEGSLEVDFRGNVVIYHKAEGIFISPGPDSAHKARALTPVVRLVLVEDV